MSFDSKKFAEYFSQKLNSNEFDGERFVTFDKTSEQKYCFKQKLEDIFGINIPCCLYEAVAFGQGNEVEKIETIYSSSLQSLVIFSQVSENNPIYINKTCYSKVYFEYKNKAIKLPSCIDVVLISNDGSKVLFVESKLAEIIRDSTEKGENEIGPSYFGPEGYSLLNLDKDKLSNFGVFVPDGIELGEDPRSIKQKINKIRNKNDNGWTAVEKLQENKYVYSYGIKQILSHLLGRHHYVNCKYDKGCDSYLDYKKLGRPEVDFVEIYNELPNYVPDKNDCSNKISDFRKHVENVLGNFENCSVMTYQDLFRENEKYFANCMDKVVAFYHLK